MRKLVAIAAATALIGVGVGSAEAVTTLTHPVGSRTCTSYAPAFTPAHTRAAYSYISKSTGKRIYVPAKYFQSYTTLAHTICKVWGR